MGMEVDPGVGNAGHSSDGPSSSSSSSDAASMYKSCFDSAIHSGHNTPTHIFRRSPGHGWSIVPPPPPSTQQQDWDAYIRKQQLGAHVDRLGGEEEEEESSCLPSRSLADLMVRDSNGELISSRDFFLKTGYIASPPELAQHRRRRDAALLRHKLDKSFGDSILDAHCQQAKQLFQADFSAISLAQIDTDFFQVMGASGAGLEEVFSVPLPRSSSLCSHAMLLGEQCALLSDRSKDWRFRNMPNGPGPTHHRQSELGFNFYASAPLMLSAPGTAGEGDVRVQVGRFCLMSVDGRDNFGEEELAQLETIAKIASDVLERRWESRRGMKLLRMQSSTSQLTSEFHQRLLFSSSQTMGADAEEKLEGDIQALLQRSCEKVVEHLEAAGAVCIGLSSRSDEEDKYDAQQDKVAEVNQSGFETTIEGGTNASLSGLLDTRNNVVNRSSGARRGDVSLHIDTAGLQPLELGNKSDKLSSKIRRFAQAGDSSHLPSSFTPAQEASLQEWMRQFAGRAQVLGSKPIEYRSPSLRKEYTERYVDDEMEHQDEEADLLVSLLPDTVGTYVVMPIMTLESDSSYAMIVYWPKEYLFEEWDSNFLKSAASIIQSACIRRNALLSERAELRVMRSVRHEMRTPLHGIIGMSTQLQQCIAEQKGITPSQSTGNGLSEASWLSKSIQLAGEDLRKLLDNLLECGANAPASPEESREEASIVHLIEASCEDELLASADRALISHIPGDDDDKDNARQLPAPLPLVVIHADKECKHAIFKSVNAGRVYKMVGQFISNAIRFSKPPPASQRGNSLVEIRVRLLEQAAPIVEVTISDNGIGMSQSFLRHFAQPFSKASTFRQGAGLGAVLGRSILNQLRGSLRVSSKEGTGTAVTLSFPPDQMERNSHDTQHLASTTSHGVTCHFDADRGASIHRMLENHFASREFHLDEEKSEQDGACRFFYYDSNSQESREKLQLLCKGVSVDQKLVIFSSLLELESDPYLNSIEASPWIYCCLNPLGPSVLEHLDLFLSQSDSTEGMQKPLSRSHRRSSSSKTTLPDYPEHSLMSPSMSQRTGLVAKLSSPPSPSATWRTMPNLSMVPESNNTPASMSTSPTEAQPRSRSGSSAKAEDAGPHDSAFSVLIVEDNPINMRMLEACVKKTRCSYKVAFDGKQAVERYKEMQPSGPSIVLLDISLPIMDGFEACKAMRAYSASQGEGVKLGDDTVKPRIVAITALSSPQDVESGLKLGMDEWRVKPANLPKLTADLVRWKKEWQAGSAAPLESPNDIGQR